MAIQAPDRIRGQIDAPSRHICREVLKMRASSHKCRQLLPVGRNDNLGFAHEIPSRRDDHEAYKTIYWAGARTYTCTCAAYENGNECSHGWWVMVRLGVKSFDALRAMA